MSVRIACWCGMRVVAFIFSRVYLYYILCAFNWMYKMHTTTICCGLFFFFSVQRNAHKMKSLCTINWKLNMNECEWNCFIISMQVNAQQFKRNDDNDDGDDAPATWRVVHFKMCTSHWHHKCHSTSTHQIEREWKRKATICDTCELLTMALLSNCVCVCVLCVNGNT